MDQFQMKMAKQLMESEFSKEKQLSMNQQKKLELT